MKALLLYKFLVLVFCLNEMKCTFKKIKTEHTILSEFLPFLSRLEQIDQIQRMIP